MNKIFPGRYRTAGLQAKSTSVVNHLARCSIAGRNPGTDGERIIVEFKTEGSESVLKKAKILATVQDI